MNKLIISIIVVAIVVGGGAFYGGIKYTESKNPRRLSQVDFQSLQNLSPEQRQQRLQELGMSGGGFRGRDRNGGGFATGEIISKDDKSITIKMRDGGSRIIFYSDTTEVGKFVNGSASDLEVGKNVSVNGTTNSDGSITAQSIQLRPNPPTPTP